MDVATFRAIHRYGAILSVVAIVGSVVAYLVGGPFSVLALPLGFLGPLCGFYFVGAVLEDRQDPTYQILGEELMRGVVWYGGSLFGWSIILSSSTLLPATPVTVLGLPAVTALCLVSVMVGLRRGTGLDLKVQTESGQLLVFVTSAIVGGFLVLYAVLVDGQSALLVPAYLFAVGVGALVWRRNWQQPRANT